MTANRPNLIKSVQRIILFSTIILSIMFIIYHSMYQNIHLKNELKNIRSKYINETKGIIYNEVNRVVNIINSRIDLIESSVIDRSKSRTYEAYNLINKTYLNNRQNLSNKEIINMVANSLRFIMFNNKAGYYFIISTDGTINLHPMRSDFEGLNLSEITEFDGNKLFKEYISIVENNGEGFTSSSWGLNEGENINSSNRTYLKEFKDLNIIIGSVIFMNEYEEVVKNQLLNDISNIRFGNQGYIFINSINGDALVANGEIITGGKKLWEVFNKDVLKTKELFQKELIASKKTDGEYIYYSIPKINTPNIDSPKTSFIYGIKEFGWIVGAGLYIDDIESEILALQELFKIETIQAITFTILLTLVFSIIILLIFRLLSIKMKNDFDIFMNFFKVDGLKSKTINLDKIIFQELYFLGSEANKMLNKNLITEQQLINSESKFRLLAENSKDMIFKMDIKTGVYDYVSPASTLILGYTPDEIMNSPFSIKTLIHPDWKEWLEEKIDNIKKGISEETCEYQIINKAGDTVWITQKNSIIKDEVGNAIYLVGRLSDDTNRKLIEEQLRHKYRMDAIGQISGGLAHDFNNILGGIMNASQVLQSPKRNLDDRGKQMVELIRKSALRASELTSKLSLFTRKRKIIFKSVNLHSILDEAVELMHEKLENRVLSFNKRANNFNILGDATEIESVFINLIINSIHATNENQIINIETKNLYLDKSYCTSSSFRLRPGNFIEIKVSDTGQGIEPDNLNKIFEPFFSTKETGKGTGLGLATTYGSIMDHNGEILVSSVVNKGTTFTIYLPLTNEIDTKDSKPIKHKPVGKGVILVVDDEEVIRLTLKQLLIDEGYTVISATNGKEAVEVYKEKRNSIDLVIMDMIMPIMNGSEAFLRIKDIDNKCRVIITSGYIKDENIELLIDSGLLGYIKKPFIGKELISTIKGLLKR